MGPPSLLSRATRPSLYICANCVFQNSALSHTIRRCIGTKYLVKVANAEKEWEKKAKQIRGGEMKSMLSILEERGLVQQMTGSRDEVDKVLTDKRIGVYVGFDPTASSLHVGHMLPLMSLFWMYVHGYEALTLLGATTAKVGDPTDRLKTRDKMHSSVRAENLVKMHYQLKRIWINIEAYGRKYGYKWEWAWKRGLLNNSHWWNKLPFMEVIQTLGPGMRLGPMLARDTVKNKMSKGDGMSFAEFTYPLLQAWDWWHMYLKRRIQMQIGGSDQYGNITAGVDAIKYLAANHPNPAIRSQASDEESTAPFGFTVPLLTTTTGEKLGKSAGNAVWLDPDKTSSFDLYGHFMKTPDGDIERYLRLLTFMPLDAIKSLMAEHWTEPSLRKAQHTLASEFLEIVHGQKIAKDTRHQHESLWSKKRGAVGSERDTESELATAKSTAGQPSGFDLNNTPRPHVRLPERLIFTKSIGKILYASGLASSSAEGHRIAAAHGAYIGGDNCSKVGPMNDSLISWGRIDQWFNEKTREFLIDGKLLFLRRGKANIRIIEVVPDAEYKISGETFPGFAESFWDDLDKDRDTSMSKYRAPSLDVKLSPPAYGQGRRESGSDLPGTQQDVSVTDPTTKRAALMQRSRQRATPWRSLDHDYSDPEDQPMNEVETYMRPDHVSIGTTMLSPEESSDPIEPQSRSLGLKSPERSRSGFPIGLNRGANASTKDRKSALKKKMAEKEYSEIMLSRFGDDWKQTIANLEHEDSRGEAEPQREWAADVAWTPLKDRKERGSW